MEILNDQILIECYLNALRLNLEPDFIDQLQIELTKRNIDFHQFMESATELNA